ncbi:MAG TPA: hypothetical protein PL182_03380 [Pseudobdellovibrionaceae bacterium]|nr:hypothetical protein [Pseudobdellovibrionaceae bacterium]
MSNISSVRRQNQDELADLQSEHHRNKKRLLKNQEEEIQDLKSDYVERRANVAEQGEAAVNHIRAKQQDSLNQAQERRRETQTRANEKTNAIEQLYRKKVNETLKDREESLRDTREKTQAKVGEIETKNEERLSKLRQKASEQYLTAKERARQNLQRMETQHGERIENLRRETESSQNRELEKGRDQMAKLRAENERTDLNARKKTQQEIEDRELRAKAKIDRLENESAVEFRKKKSAWNDREERLDKEYQNKIGERQGAYQDRLKQQKQHFDSIYQKNDEAHRRALSLQSTNAAKESNQLKKEFLRDTEKYAGKEDDPFYKVQDRGSRISENSYEYVIEAYAPEHEKDNIRVVVDKDKATIQGQRAFSDKFEAEDGKRVSSSSYQTFREEFPFEGPVVAEGMSRERDGDWIRITVPKLTRFSIKV